MYCTPVHLYRVHFMFILAQSCSQQQHKKMWEKIGENKVRFANIISVCLVLDYNDHVDDEISKTLFLKSDKNGSTLDILISQY